MVGQVDMAGRADKGVTVSPGTVLHEGGKPVTVEMVGMAVVVETAGRAAMEDTVERFKYMSWKVESCPTRGPSTSEEV